MNDLRVGLGFLVVAVMAACATTAEEDAAPPPLDREAGATDAGPPGQPGDAQVPGDASTGGKEVERCSPDHWCITDLPDEDLDLRDIRPFEDRAFAVAESERRSRPTNGNTSVTAPRQSSIEENTSVTCGP
jgi:sarcosine oxidase gamma subunit